MLLVIIASARNRDQPFLDKPTDIGMTVYISQFFAENNREVKSSRDKDNCGD